MGFALWLEGVNAESTVEDFEHWRGFENIMSMKDLEDIGKVITSMKVSLYRLGDCKKLLVSPTLYEAMLNLYSEGAESPESSEQIKTGGTLYFRGSPTIMCDHLQGMEYAFVK